MSKSRSSPFPGSQFGAACIVALALFIFSNVTGNFGIWGDDIYFIHHIYSSHGGYWDLIPLRGFLTRYYSLVYDLMGQSDHGAHLFNLGLFGVSIVLCYRAGRRFLSRAGAVAGTLFYLAVANKYDMVVCNSAGAYLVAANTFFFSVWLALHPKLGPWQRGGLIALVNWITAHLAEILIIAAPLYPLLVALRQWRADQRLFSRELFASLLPLLVFAGHMSLVYLATPKNKAPMWVRRADTQMNAAGITGMATHAFVSGASASIGLEHVRFLSRSVQGFLHHYVPKGFGVVATALVAAYLLGLYWGKFIKASPPREKMGRDAAVLGIVAAVYLVLVTPVIGLTIVTPDMAMPSRFLIQSGIGLALALALLVEWCASWERRRWVVVFPIIAVTLVEAGAFHALLYQFESSWAYDNSIRRQLKEFNVKPQIGDTIFISLPEHDKMFRFWTTAPSQYECQNVHPLLVHDFGLVPVSPDKKFHLDIQYRNQVREREEALLNIALDERSLAGYRALYPFYQNKKDLKVFGINQIEIVGEGGAVLGRYQTSVFTGAPPEKLITGRAGAVYLSYPVIDSDREARLNALPPGYSLKIEGNSWNKEQLIRAELWQEGRRVTYRELLPGEKFSWAVPLSQIPDPRKPLVLRGAADASASSTWFVDSITLGK